MADFDVCVIGSGSGNSIIDKRFGGLRVALVEGGTFGGTCINVGCIPTKMLVYPADLARTPGQAARLGVDLELQGVHWADIRDRVFGRIDEVSASGRAYREHSDTVTLFSEHARFVGPKTLELARSGTITADRFVVAAGSRAVIPDLPGLDSIDYHTSGVDFDASSTGACRREALSGRPSRRFDDSSVDDQSAESRLRSIAGFRR